MKHYVYIYLDPRPEKDNESIYVGMGTGNRDLFHLYPAAVESHSSNRILQKKIANIRAAGLEPVVVRIAHFDNREAALAREVELIAQIGRLHLRTGPLCNLNAGGDGHDTSKETKQLKSKARLKFLADPKERARHTAILHARNTDPTFQARILEKLHIHNSSPEAKLHLHQMQQNPELRKASATCQTRNADPDFQERAQANHWTAEGREQQADRMRTRNFDPDFQARAQAPRLAKRDAMTVKKCNKCGEEKPLTTEFWYRRKDGFRSYCIDCQKKEREPAKYTPEERSARSSERMRKQRRDPEFNARLLAAKRNVEARVS